LAQNLFTKLEGFTSKEYMPLDWSTGKTKADKETYIFSFDEKVYSYF